MFLRCSQLKRGRLDFLHQACRAGRQKEDKSSGAKPALRLRGCRPAPARGRDRERGGGAPLMPRAGAGMRNLWASAQQATAGLPAGPDLHRAGFLLLAAHAATRRAAVWADPGIGGSSARPAEAGRADRRQIAAPLHEGIHAVAARGRHLLHHLLRLWLHPGVDKGGHVQPAGPGGYRREGLSRLPSRGCSPHFRDTVSVTAVCGAPPVQAPGATGPAPLPVHRGLKSSSIMSSICSIKAEGVRKALGPIT